jgi:hypothetical protein
MGSSECHDRPEPNFSAHTDPSHRTSATGQPIDSESPLKPIHGTVSRGLECSANLARPRMDRYYSREERRCEAATNAWTLDRGHGT